ncbi:hypothetical protein [Hyalangium gracile]|uniref:hypothetical protein n=1 Tax=Hyalangium gracile TaxID=394092 RepID=UPI001CCE3095|nr:hypothetical protein [Hyalangium gracile]
MKRLSTLYVALFCAVLALTPGHAVAQGMLRQYTLDWQAVSFKSRGSCLVPTLQTEGTSIFSVNEMLLPTYTVAGAFLARPNGDLENRFRSQFSGSLLRWGPNDFHFAVSTTVGGDFCTYAQDSVELNSAGLTPRRLFFVSRNGESFAGVAPLELHLREINPTLSQSLLALEQAVNTELSLVYYIGPDLEQQRAYAAQLNALLAEMTDLCQRPLDSITQAELDAILSKYSAISPRVKEKLLALLADLQKSVEELRAEIDRIVAEFRGQMDAVDRWTIPPPNTGGVDLGNPSTYTPELGRDEVPEVEVPDVSTGDPWDPAKDPYKVFADEMLAELNKNLVNGEVVDRQGFLATVRLWRFNQDVFERGLKSRIGVSQEEWGAFLAAQQRVLTLVREYMGEGDWFHDSPARESTKAFLAYLEKRPGYEARAHALKDGFNLMRRGNHDAAQKAVLDSTDALAGGYEALEQGVALEDPTIPATLDRMLDGAIVVAKEVALLGLSFTPVGDFIDLCELVTGKENCNPDGADLSVSERMFAGAGLIIGSGKFWKLVGAHVSAIGGVIISNHLPKWLDRLEDISHAEKEALLQRLGDKTLEHVIDISGQDMFRILDRMGDARVKRLAPYLKNDGLMELMEFRFSKFYPPQSDIVRHLGAKVKSLPSLKGKTRAEVESVLQSRGFGSPIIHEDGSYTWTPNPIRELRKDGTWYQDIWMDEHDGSLVRIAAATRSQPYLHFKKEISDTPRTYDASRVKAKVTDNRAAISEPTNPDDAYPYNEISHPGTSYVRDQFAQTLARKTGKTVREVETEMAAELEDLVSFWGGETHLPLLP